MRSTSVLDLEQSPQRIEQSVRRAAGRFVPQRLEGWVQDLVHEAVERTGNLFPGTRVDLSQFVEQPCEFVGFQFIGLFLQALDRGRGGPVVQFRQETGRLVFNDPGRLRPFFLPIAAIGFAGLLQIVERVQIHAGQVADARDRNREAQPDPGRTAVARTGDGGCGGTAPA